MLADFEISVFYAQIVVFELQFRDLQWTDDHVAQGFAWSAGDVSFGLPSHVGPCRLQVFQPMSYQVAADTLWAVQVPFELKSGKVMVGNVIDPREVRVSRGRHNLIFEAGKHKENYAFLIKLHFVASQNPTFAILKRGTELQTDHVLREDAEVYH